MVCNETKKDQIIFSLSYKKNRFLNNNPTFWDAAEGKLNKMSNNEVFAEL